MTWRSILVSPNRRSWDGLVRLNPVGSRSRILGIEVTVCLVQHSQRPWPQWRRLMAQLPYDTTVAHVHWGVTYARWPSRRRQKFWRSNSGFPEHFKEVNKKIVMKNVWYWRWSSRSDDQYRTIRKNQRRESSRIAVREKRKFTTTKCLYLDKKRDWRKT